MACPGIMTRDYLYTKSYHHMIHRNVVMPELLSTITKGTVNLLNKLLRGGGVP